MTKQFSRQDIINLIIKQAKGFYFTEEQYEYEKTQNKSVLNKNINNIDSFCNFPSKNDRGYKQESFLDDKLKIENEPPNQQHKNTENLTLVKKKTATHFVSPDMHAIKILLEIFDEKLDSSTPSNLSDEELLNLKNKLLGELLNEPNQDK